MTMDRFLVWLGLVVLCCVGACYLGGCTPEVTCDTDVDVGSSQLTPSNFNPSITNLGYHKSQGEVLMMYGEPCFIGTDTHATIWSYCMQQVGAQYAVVGKPNCHVPDVHGGNCDLLLDLTFFTEPDLVNKYGTGVGKVTFGAQW